MINPEYLSFLQSRALRAKVWDNFVIDSDV